MIPLGMGFKYMTARQVFCSACEMTRATVDVNKTMRDCAPIMQPGSRSWSWMWLVLRQGEGNEKQQSQSWILNRQCWRPPVQWEVCQSVRMCVESSSVFQCKTWRSRSHNIADEDILNVQTMERKRYRKRDRELGDSTHETKQPSVSGPISSLLSKHITP